MPEPRSLEESIHLEQAEDLWILYVETGSLRVKIMETDIAAVGNFLQDAMRACARAYAEREVAEATKRIMDAEIAIQAVLINERDALLAVARAGQGFEQKLAQVQEAINGAFTFQQMHGFVYQGPNYG